VNIYWLLAIVEEFALEEGMTEFWRCSEVCFPALLAQCCSNKHGLFLVVVEYNGGRWTGFILVSKGRGDKGLRAFTSELHLVVQFLQSLYSGGSAKVSNGGHLLLGLGKS
jgi:hypothetical protein